MLRVRYYFCPHATGATMSYKEILYDVADNILTITLHRP